MRLQSYTKCPYGAMLSTDTGTVVRLEAWGERIFRMTVKKGIFQERAPKGDLIVGQPGNVPFTTEEAGGELLFSTGEAAVGIRRETMQMRFLRNGKEICTLSPWGMRIYDTKITTPHYKKDPADKMRFVHAGTAQRDGYRFSLSFSFRRGEKIYGLGQNTSGALDRRETSMLLFQDNNYAPVPFFVSSLGYGVFVNTEAFSRFSRDDKGTTFVTEAVDEGDWFFFASETVDDAIRAYRYLTGGVPMMPKWLFGYAQSKEHYHTQDELLSVLHEYRRRRVPLDLIVQDWNYWKEDTWSDKSFDPERYPDPAGMCRDVHDNHARIMISVWPNTYGGESHKELCEKGQMLNDTGSGGGGGAYNVFDPAACDTYWKQLEEGFFRHGMDAWWCDCSEPFEPTFAKFMEPDEQKTAALDLYCRWFDSSRINVFSLLHCRNIYDHQRAVTEEKRVVNLTRSGYAGQQRYAGLVWSGDIGGYFAELRRQVAEGLSYSVSGLPYWTNDAGGFFPCKGNSTYNLIVPYTSVTDPGYRELYTRWIEYSCFLPVMRSHGTGFPREIWNFGEEGDVFYDTVKKYIELRYRLIPYIYSTAWQVTKNGESFLRMLAFDFADDPEALEQAADSYLFGHSLLVSPVTDPMYYEGAGTPLDAEKKKTVYLPSGCDWYDFWTEKRFAGGQYVTSDTPIDRIPVYLRAGAILPMTEVMQYADEHPHAPYTVTVAPGADGFFTVYEDAGDGYGYEKGEYAEIDFAWNDKERTLTVSDRRGSFPGMTEKRKLHLHVIGMNDADLTYDGKMLCIRF